MDWTFLLIWYLSGAVSLIYIKASVNRFDGYHWSHITINQLIFGVFASLAGGMIFIVAVCLQAAAIFDHFTKDIDFDKGYEPFRRKNGKKNH